MGGKEYISMFPWGNQKQNHGSLCSKWTISYHIEELLFLTIFMDIYELEVYGDLSTLIMA